MTNLAIFASGNGSNAQNIINYFHSGSIATVKMVVCNKPDAPVIEKAKNLKIKTITLTKEDLTAENPVTLVEHLIEENVHYIILAGYLLKIPQELINHYPDKIINIHPALLPKFGGKGMYGKFVHRAVVEAGEKESGITIHLVDGHYDSGSIIFQAKCPVEPTDTPEDVAQKVHELEYTYFPAIIEKFILKDRV